MRTPNLPLGSSSLEPDRPATVEHLSFQPLPAGPTVNTTPHPLGLSTHHEGLPSSEPASLPNLSAHPQNHHYSTAEGASEVESTVEGGNDDYDMVDVEEGGAPLYDINMDETNDQPVLPLQTTPAESETAGAFTTDNVTPQPFVAVAAGPLTDPAVIDNAAPPVLPQDLDEEDIFDFGTDDIEPHPPLTNANSDNLMPNNHNSLNFLELWRWHGSANRLKGIKDTPHNVTSITDLKNPRVTYEDLRGDEYDLQGINWQHLGVTRRSARKYRSRTFHNYVNIAGSNTWSPSTPGKLLPRHGNYFRFQSMDLRTDVRLLHFQLRNIMGCASRTAVYYPSVSGTIRRLDPTTGRVRTAMTFNNADDASVSTLAADGGILMTGGFYGTYRYRSLETQDESCCYDGRLTNHPTGITNHVQIYSSRRSSTPIAAFASNDWGFRMVDLARNEIILDNMYDFALNCTALSADKRLRVMVGDRTSILITEAETGKVLESLEGHRDFVFACDWAPNGWTVATGSQDRSIRIWDARKWRDSKGVSTSVAVLTEMANARSLRFSPLGSGKPLLLAAEEADMVNFIDAQTFNSNQTIDIFGELAGVSFTGGGQEVVALSSDPIRGGVLRLERCDYGAEDAFQDWRHESSYVADNAGLELTLTQKRRQAAMAEDWFF